MFNLSQSFRHQLRPYSFVEVVGPARGNAHAYSHSILGRHLERWTHLNSSLAPCTRRAGCIQTRHITSTEPVSDPAHATTFVNLPGSEPGVDPKRDSDEYAHITADCRVDVIDYSRDKVANQQLDNQGIINLLTQNGRSRPSWAKVRWINIKGIDWAVIRTLSLTYGAWHLLVRQRLLKSYSQDWYEHDMHSHSKLANTLIASPSSGRRPSFSRLPE